MFPRPRKIARLSVLIVASIFILSSYVYLFSSPADHAHYDVMQLKSRGKMDASNFFSMTRDTVTPDNENVDETMDYTEDENRALSDEFQYSMYSKLHNCAFFKNRKNQNCADKPTVSTANHNSTVIQLPVEVTAAPIKHSYVNPHNFLYIHNPATICTAINASFLIYIHSSPVNLKKRQAIRQTWGDPKLLSLFNASLVFILGAIPEKPTQKLVDMESNKYGDIVQENFLDAYRNLTYKGMTALKWASKFCRCASFVFKADDDIILDIVSVIDNLVTQVVPSHGANRLVLCHLWTRMKPMRNKKSKWYLSKEEFPLDVFPPYCSGSFFILSIDMVSDMYDTALNSKFFWVDDYFVTGILVNSLKVKHVSLNQKYLLNFNVVEEEIKNDKSRYMVFHIRKLSLFHRVWKMMVKRHKGMSSFLRSSSKIFLKTNFNFRGKSKLLNETLSDIVTRATTAYVTSLKSVIVGTNATQKAFNGHVVIT